MSVFDQIRPSVLTVDVAGLDLWLPSLLLKPYGIDAYECSQEWEVISTLLEIDIDLVMVNPYAHGIDTHHLKTWIGNLNLINPPRIAAYAFKHQLHGLHKLGIKHWICKPLKSANPILELLNR